ncbi:GGDEF domain-containing protein [Dongshaea marina]|uniref:GGDEF domain-containing protein n=1 Tax=Dongshaea marina TaxID=2047966 RepID=UPI000D3E4C1A|nr:GGDEF domain-containing protein [Dongshaea marina]
MDQPAWLKKEPRKKESTWLYLLFLLFGIVAIAMPFVQSHYIYPKFVEQLLRHTESQAYHTATHMSREILTDNPEGKLKLIPKIQTYLRHAAQDYNLWKVKVFSSSGEVLYSSHQRDIGTFNRHDYFHQKVAKGQSYSKVVKKESPSLEGERVTSDVIETYIPIMRQGQFLGAFELYYNITTSKASLDQLVKRSNNLLYILSGIILLMIILVLLVVRHRLRERKLYEETLLQLASNDELTRIYNRRYFTNFLEWEIKKYQRYQHPSCVILFDLDHFKRVNDSFGHQAGDEVLIAVCQNCKKLLRQSDILARYGGEEFMIYLPETDIEQALQAAEKLRHSVEEMQITYQGQAIGVTISVGVASLTDLKPLTVDTLISAADTALYAAKNSGRNRVIYNRHAASHSSTSSPGAIS